LPCRKREKRERQRAAASRLNEKATSPFSLSRQLWKPWKTAGGFRTVPIAMLTRFSLSGFLPAEKSISIIKSGCLGYSLGHPLYLFVAMV